MKSVKKILKAEPYRLILEFDHQDIRVVNLESELKKWSRSPDSKFKALLDPDTFQNVKLNAEIESIYWDNGIDLCPDVLYQMSQEASSAA